MSTYRVLQDIEAEDKLVGPLTLRQCIYAAIAAIGLWLSYLCVIHSAAFMVVFLLPFIGFGVFFAFPWNHQQSTEVWALAKVRFMLKPRKRIWDQSGMKHLVDVIAPIVAQDPRQRNMTPVEVQSRLKALAATVDSRGWAVKNVPLDLYTQTTGSDRLVSGSAMPSQMVGYKEVSGDDIFDLATNPIAQQFDAKISAASQQHRQQIVQQMASPQPTGPAQPQQQWYTGRGQPQPIQPAVQAQAVAAAPAAATPGQGPGMPVATPMPSQIPAGTMTVAPQAAQPTAEELAFAEELKRRQQQLYAPEQGSTPLIQPISDQQPAATVPAVDVLQPAAAGPAASVTAPVNPAILGLANNNDLNVATIAREAKHITDGGSDEVVVSLH